MTVFICNATKKDLWIPFSPHPLQHQLSDLLMTAFLTGVKWHLKVGLTCLSLLTKETEHSKIVIGRLCFSSWKLSIPFIFPFADLQCLLRRSKYS